MELIPTYLIIAELPRLVFSLVLVIAFVAVNGLMLVYMERKVAGHMQCRLGPMEVGPHGLLQTLVDGIKLMGKEIIHPRGVDIVLFRFAPILSLAPAIGVFAVIPFSDRLVARDLNVSLLVVFAYASLAVLSIVLAGWSSNNKYGLIGAMRSVSQQVAYEIPMLISVITIVLLSHTTQLTGIVHAQKSLPFVFYPMGLVAFLIFFISSIAETNRAPFDLVEGESELTAGFHTEYSGMGFGVFFLAEYANMVVGAALATILFLGGWNGPTFGIKGAMEGIFPGVLYFLIKVYFLIFVVMWIRWTYPRLRFDQLLNLSWKILLPFSLVNLVVTAVVTKLF
ncbi:MAG: NADH-quinone oxidoreductase subunit NuoH [Pseudomonadota bacterium]